MTLVGLSSGAEYLRDAAQRFFADLYEGPAILVNSELHQGLSWIPAIRFTVNEHINVFVEPSEDTPYPRIFSLRHADVLQYPEPIAVYCVCPEEVTLDPNNQPIIR